MAALISQNIDRHLKTSAINASRTIISRWVPETLRKSWSWFQVLLDKYLVHVEKTVEDFAAM
jgi:hypothetical protein